MTVPDSRSVVAAGNRRVKRLRRLVTQRKARAAERSLVAEGPALVAEALDDPTLVVGEILVDAEAVSRPWWPPIAAAAEDRAATITLVRAGVLGAVLDPVSPQPIAAIVGRVPATLADLATAGTVVAVVEARDPGNVGTLARSAEAAGIVGLVLLGSSVDPTNPKVIRASAGAGFRLPIVTIDDPRRGIAGLADSGRAIVATTVDATAVPYDEVDLVDAAILLGNETRGLDDGVLDTADAVATIPLAGPTESLNLAVAGSLFCFEALRQRRAADRAVTR